MELSVEEQYVACALFTLALHSTVRDALTAEPFSEPIDGKAAAAGYLERDDEFGIYHKVSEDDEARIAERVAKGKCLPTKFEECQAWEMRGICERVFKRMKLPYKSWPALLATPRQALDCPEDKEVLKSYVDSLIRTLQDDSEASLREPGNREEKPVPQAIGILWALLDACIGTEEEVQGNEGAEQQKKSQTSSKEWMGALSKKRGYNPVSPGKDTQLSSSKQDDLNSCESPGFGTSSAADTSGEGATYVGRKNTEYLDASEYPPNQTVDSPSAGAESEKQCDPQSVCDLPSPEFPSFHQKSCQGWQAEFSSNTPTSSARCGSPADEESYFDKLLNERMTGGPDSEDFAGMREPKASEDNEDSWKESFPASEELFDTVEFDANFDDDTEEETQRPSVTAHTRLAAEVHAEMKRGESKPAKKVPIQEPAQEGDDAHNIDSKHGTGAEEFSEEDPTFEAFFSDDEEDAPSALDAKSHPYSLAGASTSGGGQAHSSPLATPTKVQGSDPSAGATPRDKVVILQDGASFRWYDARSRVALRRLAVWLRLSWEHVAPLESLLATQRAQPVIAVEMEETHKDGKASKYRWLKVGAAATVGGAVLALTGGLAAPALAAGVGTVMAAAGAGASAAMASAMLTTPVVAAGFGAAGAGIMGKKFDRLTAGIKELAFVSLGQAQPEDAEGDARRATDHENSFSAQQLFDTYDDVDLIDMGEDSGKECDESSPKGDSAVCAASAAAYAALKAKERQEPTSLLDEITALSDEEGEDASKEVASEPKPVDEKKQESSAKPEAAEKRNPHARHRSLVSDDKEHLAVTLAVSGWVRDMDDYTCPWYGLARTDCERFCLVWESAELLALGKALESFVRSKVVTEGTKYWIAHTAAAGVLAACAWPSLILTACSFIDNAWAVALDRAEKLGRVLADILIANFHGDKPITLVGYSLGAKAIFHCLEELHKRGHRGTVERAILLGTPVGRSSERWRKAREVVSGRLVNGYTLNDWVLGLVFRATNTNMAAGLSPVPVSGVENVNVSCLIEGHSDYPDKVGSILHLLKLA
mmetsp:Transcript_4301/g.27388  ORF Transcript_4301/g.27388 Transcript_4301/m.27388 type:complete len:1049 (-) Transcript_4301:709-3855(-)